MIMWNLLASRMVRGRHESCWANDGKHDGGGIGALVDGFGCTTVSSVLGPGWCHHCRGRREEHVNMTEQAPPWPKQGPASYFPSIEKKYGRSIAEWQQVIAGCGLEKHMAIVGYLKSEHGMGHGHANALVGWTLAGNVASP